MHCTNNGRYTNVEIVSTNYYIRRINRERHTQRERDRETDRQREREISSTKFEIRLSITHFVRFLGSDDEQERGRESKTKVCFVDRNLISVTESESLN